jgi:hypothetical protein
MEGIELEIYLFYYGHLLRERYRMEERRRSKRHKTQIQYWTQRIEELDIKFQYIFEKVRNLNV